MRLRDALGLPVLYGAFGVLVGATAARQRFVRDHVRPRPGDRVLDLGCGPGDLAALLPEQHYHGVDSNAAYIEAARAAHPQAAFVCAGIEHVVPPEQPFDLVLAVGVMHHLDDDTTRHMLALAHRCLKPGGRLVTLDGCYTPGQNRIARRLLDLDRGRFVRTEQAYRQLLASSFTEVAARLRTDLLRVPYTHFIAESTRASAADPA